MRIRTGYSFRTAVGMLDDVMAALKAAEYPVAPITDRASTFGFVRWDKLCRKHDMRPVFGVELAVTASRHEKRPSFDHWTFIAIDDLLPVHELVELATSQFRYEPNLSYDQAFEATGLIKITGHKTLWTEVDRVLSGGPPPPKTFTGLSPSANKAFIADAVARGFPLMAVSDNKYPTFADQSLFEVVCGRNASVQMYPQHILRATEWREAVAHIVDPETAEDALSRFALLAEQPTAKIRKAELLKPERLQTLDAMCHQGAVKLGVDLGDPVYRDRLERELKLIEEKEFEDYFYIIADVVQWARERMIVGPARGSSCGSLVCFLLEITTIDPLKYGLIFERFIDINRSDLPDIDIDFSDQKRELVFDYMRGKYGIDHVGRLGTVALYKPRSAMTEAAAALDIPKWKTDAVAESLIQRSSGDSRALQSLDDTLMDTPAGKEVLEAYPEFRIASRMEGHPRHYSQHAAGIILTELPVRHFVAIDRRTGATHCDKKDAEELNLLKIDALGLTQLAIFEDALEAAGLSHKFLNTIPLDDQSAFDVLNKSQWSGVFQFNGQALQSLTKQIRVSQLDDIVSITALARPGPLVSGGANNWVDRRRGAEAVSYPHPVFEPYLKDTLGIVCYQEQVMEVGRQVGGLSWEDVTALRKAMSKSLGKEFFDQYGDPWKKGAREKGVPEDVVTKVWDDMCAYGSWAFNKSHAVAYGHISYQCCWLKAHYPFEFAAATLTHESDPLKQIQTLREMRNEGFDYVPVDAELSIDRWTSGLRDGKRYLVGPVQNVKGIGPKLTKDIMAARHRGTPLPSRAAKLLANPVTLIDSLYPIGDAFARLLPDPLALDIVTKPTTVDDVMKPTEKDQDFVIFGCITTISPRNENEPQLVARRGYSIRDGLVDSLLIRISDDTGTMMAKIDRWKYAKMGKEIVDRGRPGKVLYAIKGSVRGDSSFRMMMVKMIKYIGDTDMSFAPDTRDQRPDKDLKDGTGIATPVDPDTGARIY